MFYLLFYFIINVLITVDIGMFLYIHMIIENHLPIKGQKYGTHTGGDLPLSLTIRLRLRLL